jgi:hypothetical protein
MKRHLLIGVFSLLVLFTATHAVEACRCMRSLILPLQGNQTCGDYWSAEAVFIGFAEKVELDEKTYTIKVTFQVDRPFRGIAEKTAEIYMMSGCHYPFVQGERYFVYARKQQDGKLSESACGPSLKLRDAKKDLECAEEIADGKAGTRISGMVIRDVPVSGPVDLKDKGVSNVGVIIRSDTNTYKTRTDENGIYLFSNFPSDLYHVSIDVPQGFREDPWEAWSPKVIAKPCGVKPFPIEKN